MAKTEEKGYRIEYVALSELQKWPRNPKKHDEPGIEEALERFGFVNPLILDEKSGKLVAGHGRLEVLEKRKAAGKPPPDRIATKGGEWLVPVVRGVAFKDMAEAERYVVSDNALTIGGGWDDEKLASIFADLKKSAPTETFQVPGFDDRDIEKILKESESAEPEKPKEDDRVAVTGKTDIKLGDMFWLGDHMIRCGDSENPKDVEALLGEEVPLLMVTDPPYGVEYDPAWRDESLPIIKATRSTGKVTNDDKVDWSKAWALFPGNVAYVWHASLFSGEVGASLKATGFKPRSSIVWVKPHFAISRGDYHWQHEECLYAVKEGKPSGWTGARDQSTVWQVMPATNLVHSDDPADETTGHGTQKPVELYKRAYLNHTQRGDAVYEPFSGSGSAIIAAEVLGRRCFAMELEPKYVAAAIERWEKFTNKKAKKVE